MRLHLDTGNATNNTAGSVENSGLSSQVAAAGKSATGPGTSRSGSVISDPGSHDSVAVSTASSAWSASFSDRASRVSQLTSAFQNGTYNVSSAAISQSIVASATA
jgi:anti-sigma28 factor (negative regulator of flagellin synthesis)